MPNINQLKHRRDASTSWKHAFWVIFDLKAHFFFFAHSEIRKSIKSAKAPLVSARACILPCMSRIDATNGRKVTPLRCAENSGDAASDFFQFDPVAHCSGPSPPALPVFAGPEWERFFRSGPD